MSKEKTTKIDAAIKDTKLKLEHAHQQIILMSRERDVIKKQLDSLEAIKDNEQFE